MQYKLTGNTRFRIHQRWFRKPVLVLEMEWEKTGEIIDHTINGWVKYINECYWEDATVEDLCTIMSYQPLNQH